MPLARRNLDRHDFITEAPRVDGGDGAAMAFRREGVLVGPRDVIFLGDVFGGLAHAIGVIHLGQLRIDEAPAQRRILQLHLATRERRLRLAQHERRPRHAFDAASQPYLALACLDGMRSGVDRLQARAAEPVHRLPGDRRWQPGQQQRHAGDVAIILARLVRAAHHHIFDGLGRDARAPDSLGKHERAQVIGTAIFEDARIAPNGRANSGE